MTRSLRWIQSLVFIGLWMAVGWAWNLDDNSYLLLGVPLVVLFQLFIRRQPLAALWVRRADRVRLGPVGWTVGLLLALLPATELVMSFRQVPWSIILWNAAAVLGAFGAGFAAENFDRPAQRALLHGLATAGVLGCTLMLATAAWRHSLAFSPASLHEGLRSFLVYIPVCFVLEEVVFRGAVDSHVHQPGESGPWWSATAVAALWGLWHLPTIPLDGALQWIVVGLTLILIHIPTGIFLSRAWRLGGNLLAPAIVHALIDAVRNSLLPQ